MYIIAHRGQKNDNQFMSIYNSLLFSYHYRQDINWCETDLLWTGTERIVCHDFLSISEKNTTAKFLFDNIFRIQTKKWRLILDIKWDYIYNHNHSEKFAFQKLSNLLSEQWIDNIWLQLSFLSHIDIVEKDPKLSAFSKGFLLCENIILPKIDFIDIDLSRITVDEIILLKKNYPDAKIIGFTCHKKSHLRFYKHLFNILYALVCDS